MGLLRLGQKRPHGLPWFFRHSRPDPRATLGKPNAPRKATLLEPKWVRSGDQAAESPPAAASAVTRASRRVS